MEKLPTVTIAMAVYKPNIEWFMEQLKSLNNQQYEGEIDVLIWNDSPKDFICEPYLKKYLTKFPYVILSNGVNNGVTTAFEKLTEYATGDYIAYSDQDDIWITNKIDTMIKYMLNHKDCVCCHSDGILIDKNGYIIKRKIYPKLITKINNPIYQKKSFLTKGWIIGCAMLLPMNIAKAALPFPKMVFHDQWLAIFSAFHGEFTFIPEKLIKHRMHDINNSETLHGITNKKMYYDIKLRKDKEFLLYVVEKLNCSNLCGTELAWMEARRAYSRKCNIHNLMVMLSNIKVRPMIILFEILLPFFPEVLFEKVLNIVRKIVKLGVR